MRARLAGILPDVAVILVVAAAITLVFHRLRLPAVLGYLAAGLIVGPHSPFVPLVGDAVAVRALAELGIVFLMFSVGLEFSVARLARIGPLVLVAAAVEVLVMLYLGYALGGLFGWSFADRIFLGAVLSISSTTILVKVLMELGMLHADHAPVVFGLLVVEDVVAVLILTALSTFGVTGSIEAADVVRTLLQILVFLGAAVAVGIFLVPRALDWVGRVGNDEVLVITSLGLLLAAAFAAETLGFSVALGAFLVGALVAESRESRRLEARLTGLRDMFTAVFFVSIGMLIDLAALSGLWGVLAVVSLAVIVGKTLSVTIGAFVAGNPPATALRAGISMAVIGEFSFIMADLGERHGLTSPFLFPLVVGVSLVTALASPLLMREADLLIRGIARITPAPLVTYVHVYHAWASRPGNRSPTGARRQLARAALHFTAVLGILAAARWAAGRATALGDPRLPVAVWLAAGLLSLPFAVGFARRSAEFVRRLTLAAVPFEGEASQAGRVARATVQLLATLAVGALALVAAAPFLPPGPVALLVLAAVGASLYLLGESILKMNRRVEEALDRAVRGDTSDPPAEREKRELRRLIEASYPWDVDSARVTVAADSRAAGRTLRELQLRNLTGATVAIVHRSDRHVMNPPPDWTLAPGDRLTVVGEPAQVAAALDLVRSGLPGEVGPTPAFREVEIPPASPHAGRAIGDLGIREATGATIAGMSRRGRRLPNPPPTQVLEPGDVLLLMGSAEQVGRAAVMLREVKEAA